MLFFDEPNTASLSTKAVPRSDFESSDKRTSQGRGKLDLRLAESYVPALLLTLKLCFYSSMVSMLINLPIYLAPFIASSFLAIIYVDHIYLLFSQNVAFIDTTALSSDVLFSHAVMLSLSLFDNNNNDGAASWGCSAVLVLWALFGILNLLTSSFFNHRGDQHLAAFCLFSFFIVMKSLPLAKKADSHVLTIYSNTTVDTVILKVYNLQGIQFYIRALFYNILVLVDSYTLRPSFQHETERLCICKYGAVLFSQWQLAIIVFLSLLAVQLLKIHRYSDCSFGKHHVWLDSAPEQGPPASAHGPLDTESDAVKPHATNSELPPDLNVMEAFRMAKEQYCSKNPASAHHGGKIN
jgi:hypothetical protein